MQRQVQVFLESSEVTTGLQRASLGQFERVSETRGRTPSCQIGGYPSGGLMVARVWGRLPESLEEPGRDAALADC